MMRRKIIILLLLFIIVHKIQAQKKQDISVLFVGNDPNIELSEAQKKNMAWVSSERYQKEIKTRMSAFVNYLENYFTEVKAVDVSKYFAAMSNNYDVTIFDEVPKPIKKTVREQNPKTGKWKYEPDEYVPKGFNRPSVFIGHTAAQIGRPIGSKLDWYCLCLTKWAHHIKTDHPIFQGPFKVNITLKNRLTPKPILNAWDGGDMPTTIPMWTVNTEDYTDEAGYRIGMVSRGWGFEDFPDAEVISSGQCDKQKTAVAIGCHGNFFLWGFAGSPDYMTEEAKQVFANAIVYIHKNSNKKIVAPKYNDRIATKIYLEELLFYTTIRSYTNYMKTYEEFNSVSLIAKEKAQKKQVTGKELDDREKMMLSFQPHPIKTRKQYLEKQFSRQSWYKKVGIDTLKICKYINDNRDYFYSEPSGMYNIKVDEDLKSIGIANTNKKMLEKVISMLEKEEDVEKAKRILHRYTVETFAGTKEWKAWYEKYKDKLFFTQAGGFVWMVNDPKANSKTKPRDDKEFVQKAINEVRLAKPTHENPVSVTAAIVPSECGNGKSVLIKTSIMEGYHIYAYVPSGEAYIVTTYGVELPDGVELSGKWKKSSPTPYPGKPNLLTYKTESEFKHALNIGNNIPEDAKIKIWFRYQCCDANICFPPQKKEFELELDI